MAKDTLENIAVMVKKKLLGQSMDKMAAEILKLSPEEKKALMAEIDIMSVDYKRASKHYAEYILMERDAEIYRLLEIGESITKDEKHNRILLLSYATFLNDEITRILEE